MHPLEVILWSSIGLAAAFSGLSCLTTLWLGIEERISTRKRISAAKRETKWSPRTLSVILEGTAEASKLAAQARHWLDVGRILDHFEILIARAADSDNSVDLSHLLEQENVRQVVVSEGAGRRERMARAIEQATGEFIAFTEGTAVPDASSLAYLVRSFEQPSVGLVVVRIGTIPDEPRTPAVDTVQIRRLRMGLQSLVEREIPLDADLSVFRRERALTLCNDPVVERLGLTEQIRSRGECSIYLKVSGGNLPPKPTQGAVASWCDLTRTLGSCLWHKPSLFVPWRRQSVVFWATHVTRWATPLLLAVAFVANLPLSEDPRYLRLLLGQEAVYLGLASAVFCRERSRGSLEAACDELPKLGSVRPLGTSRIPSRCVMETRG